MPFGKVPSFKFVMFLKTSSQLQSPLGVPLYPVESILKSFTKTAPTFLLTQEE